jgi:hypothetical protein
VVAPGAAALRSPRVQQAIASYFAIRGPHPDPDLNAIALAILVEDLTGDRLTDDDIDASSFEGGSATPGAPAAAPRDV